MNTGSQNENSVPTLLCLRNVYACYKKKIILTNISFGLQPGEILAVIGSNGAGKSTLLRVLAGLLPPSEGTVEIEGHDLNVTAPHERVNLGLSYFMQSGRVFQSLSVGENLEIGRGTTNEGQWKQSLDIVLDLFPNLTTLFKKNAGLLSGGERQALALAMVLLKKPRLLLLDEPSACLAPHVVRDVFEKIKELRQLWNMAVILVEQNIIEGLQVADRAIALVNGRIACETTQPKEWLSNGQLEMIFMGQKFDAFKGHLLHDSTSVE